MESGLELAEEDNTVTYLSELELIMIASILHLGFAFEGDGVGVTSSFSACLLALNGDSAGVMVLVVAGLVTGFPN